MSTHILATRDQQFSRQEYTNSSQQRKSKWLLNILDASFIIRKMQTEITMKYQSHLSDRQKPMEGNLATSTKIKMHIPLTWQFLF